MLSKLDCTVIDIIDLIKDSNDLESEYISDEDINGLKKIIKNLIETNKKKLEKERFDDWKKDNTVEIEKNVFLEQTTQYKTKFSSEELEIFFIKQYQ